MQARFAAVLGTPHLTRSPILAGIQCGVVLAIHPGAGVIFTPVARGAGEWDTSCGSQQHGLCALRFAGKECEHCTTAPLVGPPSRNPPRQLKALPSAWVTGEPLISVAGHRGVAVGIPLSRQHDAALYSGPGRQDLRATDAVCLKAQRQSALSGWLAVLRRVWSNHDFPRPLPPARPRPLLSPPPPFPVTHLHTDRRKACRRMGSVHRRARPLASAHGSTW